ncbi:MAG: hypothetical protein P8L49_10690 [Opitutaceae bacterium]|nr:hypothetical protein [Opitutaceae bacterium]
MSNTIETPTSSPENSPASSEYERQPVPSISLKGASKFWGMFAGEHAAGTEFMEPLLLRLRVIQN